MSEVEAVSGLVLASQAKPVQFDAAEGRSFIALPQAGGGFKLEQITSPNKADVLMPKVVTQHVKMQTAESFGAYINRFKNSDTLLFADIATDTIVSVIDYHGAVDKDDMTQLSPKLGNHRATLTLPKSLEWQTWNRASGQMMTHVAFATFLEENAVDVKNPVGADLLELCRDLQVAQNVNFGSSVRMGDLTQVNYQKDQDALSKGSIALPQSIMLSIPVYFGEVAVPVTAFMRRQIDDGKLKLGIQLSRAENVRQDEFHRIVDWITDDVENLTTVYGTPG
jgi:uncharacterized protein YfdQ (DUF2303 family)